jgi:nitronate monooxygenase
MFALEDMVIPIMAAPMAGGPSTPELVAAVANEGGTGFLAAGYKPVDALADEIARLRRLTSGPFGVNLFVPADDVSRDEETAGRLSDYRTALDQEAQRYGCEIPTPDPRDRDGWEEKIAFLIDNPVPFVSFTFGCPDAETISRLHDAGTFVIVTVSDEDEARTADERGADALCVQGPDAGGHRGTHSVDKLPDERDLGALLRGVRTVTDLPMIAAGGITRAEQICAALDAGAVAVQLGTVLLRSPESGASHLHKEALASEAFSVTRTTRAFSGRWARGLENRFMAEHHEAAPAAYPELNQMTRPLRTAAAAAGDVDGMALWAGTGFRDAEARPAADIVTALWRGVGR